MIIFFRVIGVVKAWIETYSDDFFGDDSLKDSLVQFIEKMMKSVNSASQLKSILQKRLEKHKANPVYKMEIPAVQLNSKWLDMDEHVVAQQICLLEFRIYSSITAKETLNNNWQKHKEHSPNVLALIEQFNRVNIHYN